MELYTLDPMLKREGLYDRFVSLIWTERFNAKGEFELLVPSTVEARNNFYEGRKLACNESYYVMEVKEVENYTDDDGRELLSVKGPSLEYLMEDRVARGTMSSTTTEEKWTLTGTPGEIARKIFNDICALGTLSLNDIIPFLADVDILPEDSIDEPTEEITVEIEIQSVYDAVKGICDLYDLGFRLLRNFDQSQLAFNIYAGSDRTSAQSVLPSVLFSPELENLKNVRELKSSQGAKNIAYVFSPVGFRVVVPQDVDPDTAGFDRHVIWVKADDITDPNPTIANALMDQRGREALAGARAFAGFDGEINQNSQYKYNVDYYLGDLVEIRNIDGFANVMRVTEQILVSDQEGDRSYPSLTLSKFIAPGTWLAWEYNQVWADLDGDPLEWADAP